MLRIHCKIIVQNKTPGKTPKRKYLFQGKSARSKHWFDIDIEWIEENLSAREPQFYKRCFQRNIQGSYGSKYPTFPVTIVNAKETGEVEYYRKVTLVEYHKND